MDKFYKKKFKKNTGKNKSGTLLYFRITADRFGRCRALFKFSKFVIYSRYIRVENKEPFVPFPFVVSVLEILVGNKLQSSACEWNTDGCYYEVL